MNKNKNIRFILSIFLIIGIVQGCSKTMNQITESESIDLSPQQSITVQTSEVTDRIIVKYKSGLQAQSVGALMSSIQASHVQDIKSKVNPGLNFEVWKVQNQSVANAVNQLKGNPNVEYAEPDYYSVHKVVDK
ncbi:MAG: hypothetical protein GY730_09630 [bacterium]|nr:hypothetical protein [bacterium]